jgi:type IV pilus assembly protein PilM
MKWLVRFLKGGGYHLPAIDIGTYSLKLVQLEKKKNSFRPVAYGKLVYEEQVFAGTEIIDRFLLADYIKRLLEENNISERDVAIHVPLAACFYSVISIPSSKNPEEAVMNYIQSIITPEELPQVKIDYKILPVSIEQDTIDIAIAAVKKDFLEERISVLVHAGLKPAVIDIEPAVMNNQFYLNHPESTNTPVCIVDIGASFTKIVISFGGYPYTTRSLELGGFSITEQLQKEFMLSVEDAEELKKGSNVKEITYEEAFNRVITKSIKKIATETMWTIENFKDRFNLDVDTIYLYGGSSKIRGLVEEFKTFTGKDVLAGFPFSFAGITGYEEYEIAVGLSLRYKGDSNVKV